MPDPIQGAIAKLGPLCPESYQKFEAQKALYMKEHPGHPTIAEHYVWEAAENLAADLAAVVEGLKCCGNCGVGVCECWSDYVHPYDQRPYPEAFDPCHFTPSRWEART